MSNWTEVVDCLEEVKEHILTTLEQHGYQQEVASDLIYMRDAIDKVLFDKDGFPRGAPVMDAEALAEKIWNDLDCDTEKKVAQLITTSIDLDITWKDNEARWGIFGLEVWHGNVNKDCWYWELQVAESRTGLATSGYEVSVSVDSKELAKQACEQALRFIVCGVKS